MVSVNSQASVFSDNDFLRAVRAPLVVVDAGAGHPIRWVNEAFVAMIDQPSTQICGRRLGEIVLDHDDESVIDGPDATVSAIRSREEILARGSHGGSDGLSVRLERALVRHEELWDPQVRRAELAQIEIAVAWRAAHGVRLWTRTAGTAMLDDHGVIVQWLLTVSDISDLVRLDASRALQVAAARQERAALALMAAVSDRLADMENPHSLRDIARLLESQIAWAGFYVNDEGLRYVEGVDMSNPPTGQGHRHGRRLVTSVPGRPDPIQSLLDGIEEGPVLLTGSRARLDGTASGWLATDVRQRTLLTDGNAVLVLPLAGRRRVLGLLVVGLPAEGQLDEETSVLVEITARRVGLAVDNVRLYAREHQMAETLQRAMLPDQAEVDGLDIWTYYAPNSDHAQVGGDWYDVLPYGNGVVGVVVGDVVGHDVEAAAAMGQLRSVVRAYAYELSGPAPVLDRVDHLMAHMRTTRAASLVLAALSRSADGWTMQYTRAGHLPPLVVRGTATHWLDAAGGALIGFGGAPRTVATSELLPGDIAIFFTDGLIERRGRALPVGMQRLVGVAAEASGATSAATFGEHLLSLLVDEPEDDIAIVVVRVPLVDEDPAHRTRQYRLPHDPASIARARHLVARACAAWALPDDANAALAVSEMVSNAVVHGWGPVGLRLEDTGEGLRIEVEDANPAPPRLTDGHPGRVGGFGMQVVARLGDWGWRPLRGGKIVWARMRSAPPGTPSAVESSDRE